MNEINLLSIIKNIEPSKLSYTEWVQVGMALKHEGYSAYDWDLWSSKDTERYKPGECYLKWETFNEQAGTIVTGGTIVQLAREQGFEFPKYDAGYALDWDDEIEQDELVVIDKYWLEDREIDEPSEDNWHPVQELIKYLQVLFESTENVGYVTSTYKNDDGKYLPQKGNYDRTAGELIQELHKYKNDIGAVIGDYKPEAGAWIRFNPLDGKGVKNENVTDYRYALVESDSIPVERQNAIIRELELPVATLVYSGGKSIHAVVKVEAATMEEYRKRVNYLYDVCKKNGLEVDTQNRNAARLSRMPGVVRNGKKQFLMATNIGKGSWAEWEEWIEGVNDDLPDPEPLIEVFDNLPPLSPPLIEGVLRQGHKMLMAGPSKAGKSFALIGLTIAIAEGSKWFGWQCTQGRVLYVNLELDRASALHRFKDVYKSLGIKPKNLKNIDIWNLRGKVVPMDKLAPKLIRRAQKQGYIAVIIDPIYKVITGDENSAEQMAHFTNQFDKVASELGASVIYCHHHSKGSQGSKKSMDRASGSGVFARDPDALIDLVELELTPELVNQEHNRIIASIYVEELKKRNPKYYEEVVGEDDVLSKFQMQEYINLALKKDEIAEVNARVQEVEISLVNRSAWRVEGTLREYPKFPPLNLWFEYPIHKVDEVGVLADVDPEGVFGTQLSRKKGSDKLARKGEVTRNRIQEAIELLISFGQEPTAKEVSEYFTDEYGDNEKGGSVKSIKSFVEKSDEYELVSVEGSRAKRIRKVND
ncbi:AAA family ATPase [Erysipelothrix rhusiopathiae]|uniref:AAA family ATPase n=1 Tax=Erysipelothrix rhusiopathiae TaxID=1648 RepID=UPI000210B4E2|nr:AAA family ATPase [Erysipelothrix rhusiopathiae]AMS11402.1 DNA primase [Erysipelothrix rhusiopathiae]AOO67900.1 DNA primase [Erysipelothrix rhusiopathiae]AWU41253.1 DNA primase [Erysipelothrix rhusiopathiae]MDV7678095.1 AAA family ATPase [Erysipelothrix rhusiopathiae]MDV7681347.1 AAA family ATPase [Erysipelothrix rhusiopathiae]